MGFTQKQSRGRTQEDTGQINLLCFVLCNMTESFFMTHHKRRIESVCFLNSLVLVADTLLQLLMDFHRTQVFILHVAVFKLHVLHGAAVHLDAVTASKCVSKCAVMMNKLLKLGNTQEWGNTVET